LITDSFMNANEDRRPVVSCEVATVGGGNTSIRSEFLGTDEGRERGSVLDNTGMSNTGSRDPGLGMLDTTQVVLHSGAGVIGHHVLSGLPVSDEVVKVVLGISCISISHHCNSVHNGVGLCEGIGPHLDGQDPQSGPAKPVPKGSSDDRSEASSIGRDGSTHHEPTLKKSSGRDAKQIGESEQCLANFTLIYDYARIPTEIRAFATKFSENGTLPSATTMPSGCKLRSCEKISDIRTVDDLKMFQKSVMACGVSVKELEKPLVRYTMSFMEQCDESPESPLICRTYYACERNSEISRTYLCEFRKELSNVQLTIVFPLHSWVECAYCFECYLVETEQELKLIKPSFETVEFVEVEGERSPKGRPMGRCSICCQRYAFKGNGEYSEYMVKHVRLCHSNTI